jgi:fermentation-respiration switch protein FrsA (DUF1100 family)
VNWLSWRSPLLPVWLWHVLYDGTRICPCERSRRWQAALALLTTEDPADWPWWTQEGGDAHMLYSESVSEEIGLRRT